MSKLNSGLSGAATGFAIGGPMGAGIGGAAGFLMGEDDNSQSYYEQMLREAQSIPLPILKEMNPEMYQVITSLNPEMENQVMLGQSATDGITLDPKYKQAQMQALSKLMDITSNNGQDAQSKADNARLMNDVNVNLQGNTGAISQNMATRGMSGGMSDLVSKQIAAQQAANRQSQMGMDINAQAQQRALSALMNQSNVANQASNTDFNQQNTRAQATDAISRFNAQNGQNVSSANTAARNNAQQFNNTQQQNTANNNVTNRNTAQQYNNNLDQQSYDNKLKKLGLVNNATSNVADSDYRQSRDQDQFLGGLFGSAAQAWSKK
jgi:hypothetical protein